MAFCVRVPNKVHHLYIVTDCVLWLRRPAGIKHSSKLSMFSGQDVDEDDMPAIFNMCILSVKRLSYEMPNTKIRRVRPNSLATLQRPLICITSSSTPDDIYADNLSRLAPGHCDLATAEDIAHDSWDDL